MPIHRVARSVAACLLVASATALFAATYIVPTDEALIGKASAIARGRVLETKTVELAGGRLKTEITLAVDRTLKGARIGATIVIEQPGGRTAGKFETYPGIGAFAPGEDVLVMLDARADGKFNVTDFALGKFHAGRNPDGIEFYRRDGLADGHVLGGASVESSVPGSAFFDPDRDAAPFERFIEEVATGARPAAAYALPNLQTDVSQAGRRGIEFEFLGSSPARWTEFQTGGSITYKDNATGETGSTCPTGCHAEVEAGVEDWNGAAGALINLVYGGTDVTISTKDIDQLDNQIQFGDPNSRITDLSSCAGTLALGGFSGVATNAGTLCAQKGSPTANRITVGAILVNNGVGSCLNSCNYEDMVAHETGHTIGAGHSFVSALMAPVLVNNRCGVLQTDDVAFAQCVYPGVLSICSATSITSVTPKIVTGVLKAIVVGSGFAKGSIVQIDSGAGFVNAPITKFVRKTKVVGKNVASIWPIGVPVDVRVFVPSLSCATNVVSSTR